MNGLRTAAAVSALAGLALIAYAAVTGDVRVGLFLIVPYVVSSSPLAALGMLLLFIAAPLWFFGTISGMARADHGAPPAGWSGHDPRAAPPGWRAEDPRTGTVDGTPRTERRVRHGGVVLLGPIPIVWGSDRRILPWMIGAGALLLLLALFAFR